MSYRLIFFFSLLIMLTSMNQTSIAAWQNIENPFFEDNLILVQVENENDIWVKGARQSLFHLSEGYWEEILSPVNPDLFTVYYSIVDSKIFASILASQSYETTYFQYSGNTWIKWPYSSDLPVRKLISDKSGGLWGYGDWGTLFRHIDGNVKIIDSPIQTHIMSGITHSTDSLWLGTRNSGIFLHTSNGVFEQYLDSSWVGQDIMTLFDANSDGVSCILDDGRVFQIKNHSITPLNLSTAPTLLRSISRNAADGTFYGISYGNELYHIVETVWKHKLTYPPYQVLEFQTDSAGVLYISGQKGLIVRTSAQSGLHFHNVADILSVEGSSSGNTVGAAFINLDTDNDLDLFIFNHDNYYPPRLYLNHGGSLFSEFSFEAGLLNIKDPLAFVPGDFDMEGSADLAIAYQSNTSYNMKILFQITAPPLFKHEQSIKNLGLERAPIQLLLSDVDQDLDPDIFLVSYKSSGSNPGSVRLIKNKFGSKLIEQDSAFQAFGNSWFTGISQLTSPAGQENTYYASNFWSSDKIINLSAENGYRNNITHPFTRNEKTNTFGVALGDYDNDGDMDLFRTLRGLGLQIFENENGTLVQRDEKLLPGIDSVKIQAQHINLADFNNDGFLDIFLTNSSSKLKTNILLLNQAGLRFTESGYGTGVNRPAVTGTCLGDLEGDGDIDIYGFRRGTNQLWVNDHDSSNFILIKQTGSSGFNPNNSSFALFYLAGHIGEPDALLGRRQSRASNSNPLAFNASDIHFGMGSHHSVDLILYSSHGQEIRYLNVAKGTTLELPEYIGFQALYHEMEKFTKRIVNTPRISLGLLGLFINLLGHFYFIRYMRNRFHWKEITSHASGSVNLLLYISLFYLSDFGSIWVTFTIPLGLSQSLNLGVVLLHVLYEQLSKRFESSEKEDSALQKVMIFAHGEWALKNINSLILYFQNYETASKSKLSERILGRVETFLNLTLPAIRDLWQQVETPPGSKFSMPEINSELELLENDLSSFLNQPVGWQGDSRLLANRLSTHLNVIRIFKQDIYAENSSNPYFVIKQLIRSMEDEFTEQQLTVELILESPKDQMALISQSDLLAILDNCIRNAARAVQNQERKILRVRMFDFAPRLRIQIMDSGQGVANENVERIFEPGWSATGGTGLGLFQAKEILKKYAATINLEKSGNQDFTIFTIDLHKGVQK